MIYFLEETSKQIDHNEIFEIYDQAKPKVLEWHETFFEEHPASEVLEKVGHTNKAKALPKENQKQ
jgi:hypothetical protein